MPLQDYMRLISVDDHVVEPPNVWAERLPSKYQQAGPHVERLGEAQDWVWEGRRYPVGVMGSPRTRIFKGDGTGEELRARSFDEMAEGTYQVDRRVEAMDQDGVWAQLLFPQFPRFAGTRFLEATDMELAMLMVQAYNDWMIDDWCAAYPDRFIPMIIVPLWDPVKAKHEIVRCAAKGAKAITFCENPAQIGLPSFWTQHWDPVFGAAEETGLPLCLHIGTSGSLALTWYIPECSIVIPV
jgi:predicted TIM-barrel fold metal-dependent hydrolase